MLTRESHALLLSHAVGVRRVDEASAAAAVEKAKAALAAAERDRGGNNAQWIGLARKCLDDAERCHAFRRELLDVALRVEANVKERAKVKA